MPVTFQSVCLRYLAFAIVVTALPITNATAQDAQNLPSVIVIEVSEQEVTPVVKYPGRAEAVETVELRARVEGFLEQRNFREGADVAKGDILFVIE
jgi:membrane fusion protein (multidrug efflux system)